MMLFYKFLVMSLLLTLVTAQNSLRGTSRRTTASRASALRAAEQARTLGILGPLLRLSLRAPLRTGTLADPFYYGGTQSAAYPGVGFGGGYRPPVAYPTYASTQQSNYGGLGAVASAGVSPGGSIATTTGYTGGSTTDTAQQAQIAALLGQALGSSLRPLLAAGANGGSRANVAVAATPVGSGASPYSSLLSLFG